MGDVGWDVFRAQEGEGNGSGTFVVVINTLDKKEPKGRAICEDSTCIARRRNQIIEASNEEARKSCPPLAAQRVQ